MLTDFMQKRFQFKTYTNLQAKVFRIKSKKRRKIGFQAFKKTFSNVRFPENEKISLAEQY